MAGAGVGLGNGFPLYSRTEHSSVSVQPSYNLLNRISSLWKLLEAINVARTSDTKAGDLAPVPDRLQAYVCPQ